METYHKYIFLYLILGLKDVFCWIFDVINMRTLRDQEKATCRGMSTKGHRLAAVGGGKLFDTGRAWGDKDGLGGNYLYTFESLSRTGKLNGEASFTI